MSRHYFNCQIAGQAVRVILGYDRPLNEFFLQIQRLEVKGSDESPYLYASLDDPFDTGELAYYRQKLFAFGVIPPQSLFDAVEQDGIHHVANREVEHFMDRAPQVLRPKGARR